MRTYHQPSGEQKARRTLRNRRFNAPAPSEITHKVVFKFRHGSVFAPDVTKANDHVLVIANALMEFIEMVVTVCLFNNLRRCKGMTIYGDSLGGVVDHEQWHRNLAFYCKIVDLLDVNPCNVRRRHKDLQYKRKFMRSNSIRGGATCLSEDDYAKIVSAGFWAENQNRLYHGKTMFKSRCEELDRIDFFRSFYRSNRPARATSEPDHEAWNQWFLAMRGYLLKPRPPDGQPTFAYPQALRNREAYRAATPERKAESDIADWASRQRRAYKNKMNPGHYKGIIANISDYRIAKLNTINFIWDYRDVGSGQGQKQLVYSRFDP